MKVGDQFTMDGCYRRRTWREWLRREPRVLQVFRVASVAQAWFAPTADPSRLGQHIVFPADEPSRRWKDS